MGYLANPKLILMKNNMIARQDDMPNANYEYPQDPTITTNPQKVNMSWLNTVTGETFICTDNTVDSNYWVGNLGTLIYFTYPEPTGALMWWDAAESKFIEGTGGIYAVENRMNTEYHLDQITAAQRVARTENSINGLPAFVFVGGSQTNPDNFILRETISLTAFTYIYVSDVASAATSPHFGRLRNNEDYVPTLGMTASGDAAYRINSGTEYYASTGYTPSASTEVCVNVLQRTGSTFSGRCNGYQSSGVATSSETHTGLAVGRRGISSWANGYTGKFGEILIYNSLLSSSSIEPIEGYLASKWGITLNPAHPYA